MRRRHWRRIWPRQGREVHHGRPRGLAFGSDCGVGVQVLLATTAGADHLGPLVTLGFACHRFGHNVVVAAPASFAAAVQRAGFAHAPFADPAPAVLDAVTVDIPGLAAHEANVRVLFDGFARIDATAALPGLQALLVATRCHPPGTFEDGSYVAAERNEIPHAQVGVVLAWFEEFGLSVVEAPLNKLRASVGLGPDPGLVRLRAAPRLTCVPMSLEDPAVPGPGHTYRFWDSAADRCGAGVADWWNGSSALLVYVSLGTAAARPGLFPDLDRAVVGSLADLPVRVLLPTGGGDPVALAELRPLVPVGRPVVGTAGAGWGDVVERHLDRVGRVGEVDHVGASHVRGVDGGLRDAEQPPSRKSSRQFAIAVRETPSRRAASATPVGGGAEARPPADGPCDARGCQEPDERGDGGDGAGRWTPVGSVLVRLALGRRSARMLSPPQRVGGGVHAGCGPTLDTRTPALGCLGLGSDEHSDRGRRPRATPVAGCNPTAYDDTRNARISDPLNQTGCRTRRCPDWAR